MLDFCDLSLKESQYHQRDFHKNSQQRIPSAGGIPYYGDKKGGRLMDVFIDDRCNGQRKDDWIELLEKVVKEAVDLEQFSIGF